jgi:hypothetical protein
VQIGWNRSNLLSNGRYNVEGQAPAVAQASAVGSQ